MHPDFPTPQMITVNGVTLEVFTAGSANSKPLVLCHGWPEHAYSWRHQIRPLVEAGYHVIVPNQRGYGGSDAPQAVTDYDINALTGDLTGLLDHFGYQQATFIGHDWGAIIVWALSVLAPDRVAGVINLSVPYIERAPIEWIALWEQALGGDFYIVHFNRQPGVADRVFADNTRQFLRNMYRTNQWQSPPVELEGMAMIAIAERSEMPGDPIMSEQDLEVFASAFDRQSFTPGLNWYRNFSRNWEILGKVEERVQAPTLMIYGNYDMVLKSATLSNVVPNLEEVSFECGHWIQQEQPEPTNAAILDWLARHYPV